MKYIILATNTSYITSNILSELDIYGGGYVGTATAYGRKCFSVFKSFSINAQNHFDSCITTSRRAIDLSKYKAVVIKGSVSSDVYIDTLLTTRAYFKAGEITIPEENNAYDFSSWVPLVSTVTNTETAVQFESYIDISAISEGKICLGIYHGEETPVNTVALRISDMFLVPVV